MSLPRLHPDAESEYVDALLYLEEQREGYGARFEAEVEAALERIREFPIAERSLRAIPPKSRRGRFRCEDFGTR